MNTNPAREDDLLRRASVECCERLICVYRRDEKPDWWQTLCDQQEDLFSPAGRLATVYLGDTAKAVDQAVNEGYRPILFLSDPSDWPRAYDSLGVHKAFSEIYVIGQDDGVMEYLLHHPSAALDAIYEYGGSIAVPNEEYGEALDKIFPADLTDFRWTGEMEAADSIKPVFQLSSRLNPYRRIDLTLFRVSGEVMLRQYLFGANRVYECPISIHDELIDFQAGECLIKNRIDWTAAIVKNFSFPITYGGWAMDGPKPLDSLLGKLAEMSAGIRQFLSPFEQGLLFAPEIKTLLPGADTGVYRKRGREKQSAPPIPDGTPILMSMHLIPANEAVQECQRTSLELLGRARQTLDGVAGKVAPERRSALRSLAICFELLGQSDEARKIRENLLPQDTDGTPGGVASAEKLDEPDAPRQPRGRHGNGARPADFDDKDTSANRIAVHWIGERPWDTPELVVHADGARLDPCPAFWTEELDAIILVGQPFGDFRLGWEWHGEEGRLEIAFSKPAEGAGEESGYD